MKTLACADVGLDCGCIIKGETEEEIEKNSLLHFWEIHAIKPEDMTSEMKVRIKENIRDL
jgi:predicted small metal-binding protein